MRPGTECVPSIAGFGAAAENIPNLSESLKKTTMLRDRLTNGLMDMSDIVINSPPDALPYIINFSVLGQKSEPMLNFLSQHGVYVSSGSACAKGKPSRVLQSMGLAPEVLSGALRVSFSHTNTMDDVDKLLEALDEVKQTLYGPGITR